MRRTSSSKLSDEEIQQKVKEAEQYAEADKAKKAAFEEGRAVAQVCLRNDVKFTALKSVSDRLCHENNADEFFNFGEAMAKLNTIVLPVARKLRDGE